LHKTENQLIDEFVENHPFIHTHKKYEKLKEQKTYWWNVGISSLIATGFGTIGLTYNHHEYNLPYIASAALTIMGLSMTVYSWYKEYGTKRQLAEFDTYELIEARRLTNQLDRELYMERHNRDKRMEQRLNYKKHEQEYSAEN